MAQEISQGLATSQPLDLDEEPTDRLAIRLGGRIYWMQTRLDLSFAEQEELRLIYVQLANIRESPAGEDGFPSDGQYAVMEALELRLCALALADEDETGEALAALAGDKNSNRRNKLLEAFLKQPGMPGELEETRQRVAASVLERLAQMQAAQTNRPTTPPPVKLEPLEQPAGSTRKSRRASNTGTAAAG